LPNPNRPQLEQGEAFMTLNSMSRIMLAVVLSISLIATGCSTQWISVALADLPVLTQMALNIAALVATLQSGRQLTSAEALAIQNVSAEASKDLTLLQSLYNSYKTNPSSDTLQKIESDSGLEPEPAGAPASCSHQRPGAFRANHCCGKPDPCQRQQLCLADSTCTVSSGEDGATRNGHSSSQGLETAVEPAGMRSHRQSGP
jgi:hypothetical protein